MNYIGNITLYELKKQLDTLMSTNNINASQLSKITKVPKSTNSDWLGGSGPKNISQIKQVADFFEVSLNFLCFVEQENTEFTEFQDEINAEIFEVVLRRIKRRK